MRRAVQRKTLLAKTGAVIPERAVRVSPGPSRSHQFISVLEQNPKASVLVIRGLGGVGDVLMTTPAVRELKRLYPECTITYACDRRPGTSDNYYKLLWNAPFIDRIIDARMVQAWKFDAVVDITSVCINYERRNLPSRNRVDIFADAMGIRLTNPVPFYRVEVKEREWATQVLAPLQGKRLVLLHTASFEGKRSWPPEKYTELVRMAEGLNVHFLVSDYNRVYGGWANHKNCTDVSASTIRELAALIEQVDLFVGPDSGPMHIAGALGTKSIVLFGSIPPEARINHYPSHRAIRADGLHCLGCWYRECPYNTRCMRDIDSSRVLATIKSILEV